MNNIVIAGRVVREPETRYLENDNCMVKFDVAVNKSESETDFFSCTAFGGVAETIAQYVGAGDQIIVSGSMNSHKYVREDESTATFWSVTVRSMDFGAKKAPSAGKPSAGKPSRGARR